MVDLDDVFAYNTKRWARIRHRGLGCTYRAMQFGIFVYICLFNLFYRKGYLSDVGGLTMSRMALRNPETELCPNTGCTLQSPTKLPYCKRSELPAEESGLYATRLKKHVHDCSYRTGEEVVFPPMENGALLATTFMSTRRQSTDASCFPPTEPHCMNFKTDGDETSGYVAEVEDFILHLDHSVGAQSPTLQYGGNAIGLSGSLHYHNGTAIDPCDDYVNDPLTPKCPDYIRFGQVNHTDEVKLATLLRAAGIDLDAPANLPGNSKETGAPWRQTGVVLMLNIQYSNRHLYYTPKYVQYKATVHALSGTGFAATEILHSDPDAVKRVVVDRRGIRVILAQTTNLGTFSFAKVLTTLVAGTALLSVAVLSVDMALKYVRNGDLFYYLQYKKSPDFTPDDDDERQALENYKLKVRDPTEYSKLQAATIRHLADVTGIDSGIAGGGGGGGKAGYSRVGGPASASGVEMSFSQRVATANQVNV